MTHQFNTRHAEYPHCPIQKMQTAAEYPQYVPQKLKKTIWIPAHQYQKLPATAYTQRYPMQKPHTAGCINRNMRKHSQHTVVIPTNINTHKPIYPQHHSTWKIKSV
jgi:hypothetical protein